MSLDNHITLRGYLTAEPKLHQKTAGAIPVTEIRIGSTPRRLNRETGEWRDAPTSYYTVKCWRRLAINAASSLHKGDMVVIRGHFYMNRWVDSENRTRSSLEIEADSLGHDLAYGWSHFLRGSRPQPEVAAGIDAGEMARQDLGPVNSAGGDEYSADTDLEGADTGGADAGGAASATLVAQATFVTEGDDGDDLQAGDAMAASGLTEGDSLKETDREPEAVPF